MAELTPLQRNDRVIWAIMCDPRHQTENDWFREYSPVAQLMRQGGEDFALLGHHPDPDRTVTIEMHEQPDWEWWEPWPGQRWRREESRLRYYTERAERGEPL